MTIFYPITLNFLSHLNFKRMFEYLYISFKIINDINTSIKKTTL